MMIAIVVVVMIAVIVAVVPVIAVIVPMFVTMVFTIVRNVGIGVPVMPDEVDRLAAGVVLAAMVAPIALIAWAHMQIDRRRQHAALNAYAHDGGAIDEAGRRRVADIHASVKSGIAQVDGDPHLCERCAADCQRRKSGG
jgi:hypothetical protein